MQYDAFKRTVRELVAADRKIEHFEWALQRMVLRTLETMGPQHGYGIARRIEQVSDQQVLLNQGTIYASLVRLQQSDWIAAEWGVSDNNRRAKFYTITPKGRRRLAEETEDWRRLAGVVEAMLGPQGSGR